MNKIKYMNKIKNINKNFKKNSFFVGNIRIIKVLLKQKKFLLLFLTILFFLISIVTFIISFIQSKKYAFPLFFAPLTFETEDIIFVSIYLVPSIIFSFLLVQVFAVLSFFLSNIFIIKQINQKTYNFWAMVPLSRLENINSRIFAILIFNIFLFFPSFILSIIFSSFCYNNYVFDVFLQGINFFILTSFISIVFVTISVLFINNSKISLLLKIIILVWIFLFNFIWNILKLMELNEINNNKLLQIIYYFFKYFRLNMLLINTLDFSNADEPVSLTFGDYNIFLQIHKEINSVYYIVSNLLMVIFSVALTFLSNFVFLRKDLNI